MNALAQRNKNTDIQAIRNWYQSDDIELTPHQETKRKRLLKVISMMYKGKSNQKIIKVLEKDHELSSRQAYRDLRDAISLYGDIRKAEKEGIRFLLFDMAEKTYRRAAKADNLKAMNAAIANMIKITGVDREDPELPDFSQLQPSLIVTVIPEPLENAIVNQLNQGPVDLSKAYQQYAEDIEYSPADSTGTDQTGDSAHP